MSTPGAIDIGRALVDFDGNRQDVAEMLLLFLDELDLHLSMLESGRKRGRSAFAAQLHEIANSLQSVWCFGGGERVRALEAECRQTHHVDPLPMQREVQGILIDAAEQARAWLQMQMDN
jgi:hypothetical protein